MSSTFGTFVCTAHALEVAVEYVDWLEQDAARKQNEPKACKAG